MAEKYKSKYTGRQIDSLLARSAIALTELDRANIVAEIKSATKQEIESNASWGEF